MLALNQCFGSRKGSGPALDGRLDPDSDPEGLKRAKKEKKNAAKRQLVPYKKGKCDLFY
jgi:hypothetical protein